MIFSSSQRIRLYAKTRITHPDVEYVYSEDGISIYSDIDLVEPILL